MGYKGERLEEGSYSHPWCEQCEPTGFKSYLDSDTRWVTRMRHCQGNLVDFSLLLQVNWAGHWRFVTRFSVAHANFHQIRWFRDTPPDQQQRRTHFLLDTREQIDSAYQQAVDRSYPGTAGYIHAWEVGP
ncbi:MAG: hypothetical protein GEU83_18260 [Pseudonocardiaceae bacterium]|nr:hypothetical protein [Pseudonocardiaceae bacterium]